MYLLDKKPQDYGYLHNVFYVEAGFLILISPILSYLPHGSSEGWSSEFIRSSRTWLNSFNSANFAVYPSVHLKSIAHLFKFHSKRFHSLRYENVLVHEASAPQFIGFIAERLRLVRKLIFFAE